MMNRLWPFGRRRAPQLIRTDPWDLSTPLIHWSLHDPWTIGSAVEGTLDLGATGAGKSSGSGRTIALSMLDAGFGGLVLTAKPGEREQWENYCRLTNRLDDLVTFGVGRPHRFNVLDHELHRPGAGAGLTENIVRLFAAVMEVADRGPGGASGGGRESEPYWRLANRQLVRNAVDLLILAKGRVSVPVLYRLVVSAPTSLEMVRSEQWKTSLCFRCMDDADKRPKTPQQKHDFAMVADYFCLEYPALSEKTRSVIVSTFTSMVDVLNRGVLRELFCEGTNLAPDDAAEGKVILIDLDLKQFGQVGLFAQILWKTAFQRSMERRDIAANPRPVFLWADEAQFFVTGEDAQFQTTCRSSRVATVLLSQNVSNFYAVLGGGNEGGRAAAESLLANLNTKVFHANSDPITNEWASSMIGRTRRLFMNASSNHSDGDWMSAVTGLGRNGNTSGGVSEQMEFEVNPASFSRLRTGGPHNGWLVDAVLFASGKVFAATGKTWMPVTFTQR